MTLRPLSPEEGRVIGSLVEKQLTTPLQYPLTLNALVAACNQSSNRDPVVSYSERVVEAAVMSLRDAGLAGFMYPSHGRTVTRYRHMLEDRLGLDERELALIAALLLRGPQTAGELRSRTDRMAHFDGIEAVDNDLERLSGREEPLVLRLERRPGQKEERWVQLLTGPFDQSAPSAASSGWAGSTRLGPGASLASTGLGSGPPSSGAPSSGPPSSGAPSSGATSAGAASAGAASAGAASAGAASADRRPSFAASQSSGAGSVEPGNAQLSSLAEQVVSLRAEVAELRAALEQLQEQLGG